MTNNEVSTLKKGLLVLELVSKHQGITLREVTDQLQMSKSTAFRNLATLEQMDYIYKIKYHYFLNAAKFAGSRETHPENEWVSLQSIYQIAKSLEMSTYLGKVDHTDLVMTQVLHAPFTRTAEKEVGNRSKLHQSALGKVILAHLPEEQVTVLLEQLSLEPATENTFQDSQLFRYHLKVIREEGYAFDDEERNIGIRCLAVPVFRQQKVVAALAIAAPTAEVTRSNMKNIVQKLRFGSEALTKEIEAVEQNDGQQFH